MLHMASNLTGSQQAYWATLAQVNAALVIALVVEVGLVARQRMPDPDSVPKMLRTFAGVFSALAYVFGAADALAGIFEALGVLSGGVAPKAGVANSAIISTLIAAGVVVGVPILRFAIWYLRLNGLLTVRLTKDTLRAWRNRPKKPDVAAHKPSDPEAV